MSEDWSISPPLPDKVFPWEKYNPVTREEVNEFFHSPEILVIKERMCDIGRRLWNREYVDGNGGNISVRVAQNLLLCSPTLCSKGFMTVEDICMVDMDARQKAGIRPSTSEVKTHIAMMKSVGVNACIHAHPPHCNAFLFAGQVPPSGINPEADIFLGHIPLAPYGTPGSLETARAVAEAARQSTVVFMENHGVITGARDVEEAEWFMENADAYCRMVLWRTSLPFANPSVTPCRTTSPCTTRKPTPGTNWENPENNGIHRSSLGRRRMPGALFCGFLSAPFFHRVHTRTKSGSLPFPWTVLPVSPAICFTEWPPYFRIH